MMILIAGPVRSGTQGDQTRIAANLQALNQMALQVYHKGHTPVVGEWLALPIASAAGSACIGDAISERYLYPVAHRLIHSCDAILRLPGASGGADNDVALGQQLGLEIFQHIDAVPEVSPPV
ncbi:NUDIX hydrolase [Candidatus Pantoea soli]|uniref:NUDIX hydrolase n=1 Tax=Candidatus Pantoea soli TaxID=3098669 RepID=A0A518XIZ4_9GAMM|nr:NUDIX hydrolase [Pantoea soli]QDY44139.1 NUDIX hydrolase [Pantoea soli]